MGGVDNRMLFALTLFIIAIASFAPVTQVNGSEQQGLLLVKSNYSGNVAAKPSSMGGPPPPPPVQPYDFLMYSAYWPPTAVPADAHSRARHLIHQQDAYGGFWTHGLWPSRLVGKQPEYCSGEVFKPETLGPFENSLLFYLRSPFPTTQASKMHTFWSHEWSRHGTCSGKDQLSYFMQVYQAATRVNIYAALSTARILPSNLKPYTKGQIQAALQAKFGTAFSLTQGMTCTRNADNELALAEVRLCMDKALNFLDCSKLAAAASGVPEREEGQVPAALGAETGDRKLSGSQAYDSYYSARAADLLMRHAAEDADADAGAGSDDLIVGSGADGSSKNGSSVSGGDDWVTAAERAAAARLWRFQVTDVSDCTGGPEAAVWVPDFQDNGAVAGIPWGIVLGVGTVIALVTAGLMSGYNLLQKWRMVPTLFLPRDVKVVHYDLVQRPVKVLCQSLDMGWLWNCLPAYAEFIDDLPVGMGIKGGIARKLLKERFGVPEPPGSFDVDVLLFVDEYTAEIRKAARELVTGMKLGGLVLEPQDVEVLTKDWLSEYFVTRDVTMNEVLILKIAPGTALFFYTEDAQRDVQLQLIRPCVHCLKTEYHMAWALEEDGTPYTAAQQVVRSLVRYIKGHGKDYAFDEATWRHYRREKLTKTELFKVLKPFHDDDAKLQTAVDHLISIGFLCRNEVRKAGGINMLWGLLLMEINAQVSKFGSRMVLTELDPDAVEKWVDQKKATVAAKLISQEMRSRRTGFVPSEESVIDMGLLSFPPQLHDWMRTGRTFDMAGHLARAASTLTEQLAAPHQGVSAASAVQAGKAAAEAVSAAEKAKQQWLAVKQAAQSQGDAVYKVVAGAGASSVLLPEPGAAGATGAALRGDDALAVEFHESVTKLRQMLVQPGEASSERKMEELQSVQAEAVKRQNKEFKESMKGGLLNKVGSMLRPTGTEAAAAAGGDAAPAAGSSSAFAAAHLQQPADGAAGAAAGGAGAGGGPVDASGRGWVRFSQLQEKIPDTAIALPGSFYQAVGGAGGEENEYVPLVSDKETPQRKRVEILRMLRFIVGVMAIDKRLLLIAYVLMLAGLLARLCTPRIEAAIFDAFNDLDASLFKKNIFVALGVIGADVSLTLLGKVVLELFTRKSMRTLFRRFFEHVIFQDLPFFNRLSAGELMARTSGDSLTLRSIVSTTTYQIIEGSTLFFGSIVFLLWSAFPLITSQPGISATFLIVVALNVCEAAVLGLWLRSVNLAVRQALGRMFGFTLDAFSKIETVAVLGLEPRMLLDYKEYARDYFRNAFYMNTSLHAHQAFTAVFAAALRFSLLWFGGAALFADLTTVGTLFALLRYVQWMQKGMKTASDAYARLMAGLGSVERIVELHDRGIFGNAPGTVLDADEASEARRQREIQQAGSKAMFRTRSHDARRQHAAERRQAAARAAGLRQPLLPVAAALGRDEEAGSSAVVPGDSRRPDFSRMMGGIKLTDIHLTMRSKTDRLLLHDCCVTVLPGEICLLAGDEAEGKSGLMDLVMLRMMPYKGYVSYQLPDAAVPAASSLAPRPVAATVFQAGISSGHETDHIETGGPGWKWASFSFRQDDMRSVRGCISYCSVGCAGVFRTTVEDNIAVATPREVTSAEVREVCSKVGLHEAILQLPDGYGTLIGEGTGHTLSQPVQLRLVVARALLRRPRIFLLDDADAFWDALGSDTLMTVLEDLRSQGAAVLVASNRPYRFPQATRVYSLHHGKPITIAAPPQEA